MTIILCIPTGQNTTTNNGDDGSSSAPAASIVGFAVVLAFLLVALCLVILLCIKFGTLKCPWSPAQSGTQPIILQRSTLRTETQVEAQAETEPQAQQLHDESVSSTNLNQIRDTISFEEQPHPRVLTLAQVSEITSNLVLHSVNSIPNSPHPQNQKPRDTAQRTSISRVPPLQVIHVDPLPPYPAKSYPYQPCKSPSTLRTQATTPITPVAYTEATTPVTPVPYGAQQLQTATPVTTSEQSLTSRRLQLNVSTPSYHTEV